MDVLTKLADAASLNNFDRKWQQALNDSLVVRLGTVCKSVFARGEKPALAKLGSTLQTLGFCVSLVLFVALGLPQFKDDKEGLGLISLAGFALWLAGYVFGGKESRRASSIDMLVLLFFAANIVATCASHYFAPAIRGLAKLVVYICSYFYLTAILNQSPKRKLILVSVLVAMGVVESLVGFDQYRNHVQPLATWEDPTVESQGTRIFSFLGNPNLLAGYLIPLAPLALALGFGAIASGRILFAIPPMAAAGIITTAIVLTGSRGGYLAIGAACASIFFMGVARLWTAKPKARIVIVACCVVLPIVLFLGLHFVPSFEQRITSIFAGREHSSNSYRINVWHASWRMFLDNWWIGIGPGNQVFRLAYGLYMVSGYDALGTYCVPLEIAVECGIFGLILFALLVVSLLARAHISFWCKDDSGKLSLEQWLTAGAVAALVGMFAQGMVDTVFYRPQVQFIFWLVVSLIVTDTKGASSIKRNS